MGTRFSRTREKTAFARALRKRVTKTEAKLWLYLRNSALGAPFRRQHPVGPYFADYYCAPLKLCIEVDGDGHDAARDARRDAYMEGEGITVLRFAAWEVGDGIEGVVLRIRDAIRERQWMIAHGEDEVE
jgi:very-short-patch-repair endonuclease